MKSITDPNDLGLINVHHPDACKHQSACPLHRPSGHMMRSWPVIWRDDRQILERLCPCGIGHPDPDQMPFWERTGQEWNAAHGCCGCCFIDLSEVLE